jgi:hypothetical protein
LEGNQDARTPNGAETNAGIAALQVFLIENYCLAFDVKIPRYQVQPCSLENLPGLYTHSQNRP